MTSSRVCRVERDKSSGRDGWGRIKKSRSKFDEWRGLAGPGPALSALGVVLAPFSTQTLGSFLPPLWAILGRGHTFNYLVCTQAGQADWINETQQARIFVPTCRPRYHIAEVLLLIANRNGFTILGATSRLRLTSSAPAQRLTELNGCLIVLVLPFPWRLRSLDAVGGPSEGRATAASESPKPSSKFNPRVPPPIKTT
jgi:hypothetical protein